MFALTSLHATHWTPTTHGGRGSRAKRRLLRSLRRPVERRGVPGLSVRPPRDPTAPRMGCPLQGLPARERARRGFQRISPARVPDLSSAQRPPRPHASTVCKGGCVRPRTGTDGARPHTCPGLPGRFRTRRRSPGHRQPAGRNRQTTDAWAENRQPQMSPLPHHARGRGATDDGARRASFRWPSPPHSALRRLEHPGNGA